MGVTLSHEHLFINLMAERRGDGLVHDEALLIKELSVFRAQGGGTIFDLTTAELTPGSTSDSEKGFDACQPGQTRNPKAVEGILRISQETGVHVVLGTGRYRDPFLQSGLILSLGPDGLAREMINDLQVGFPETDIRAGLIGEIGADKWYLSDLERTVFLAASIAHAETGAAIYTHAARWRVGLEQSDVLLSQGVAPNKIAIGHVDTVPDVDYALSLADRGHFVGIDTINSSNAHEVARRVEQVMALVNAGHQERILLAHDVCLSSQLQAFGGNGFAFVLSGFRQALLEAGLTSEQFSSITMDNPRNLLE